MRRRIRFLPILFKLILCFSFIFIFVILLYYFNFSIYSKDKEKSTSNVVQQANIQIVNKIEDYMQDMNSITKFPLFRQTSDSGFLKKLEEFSETSSSDLDFQKLVEKMNQDIINYKQQVHSVFLFNLNGKSEYMLRGISLYKSFDPRQEDWFKKSVDYFGKPVIVSTYALPNVAYEPDRPVYVFSMARALVRPTSARVLGVILVNTSVDFLSSLCEKVLTPNQRVIIVDKGGKTIYDTLRSNITKPLDSQIMDFVRDGSEGTDSIYINSQRTLVSFTTSNYTKWKIISLVPWSDLNREVIQMRNTSFKLTFLLGLVIIIFAFVFSRQIVAPIRKLVMLMRLVEKGDFDVKIKSVSHDEIGLLAKQFNRMTKKLNQLIQEVYLDKLKQKEFELQMLQSQINPHFLYNTLEAIHMMAEINKDHEASKMATSLGKIMRYAISRDQTIVTVREELTHLQHYIQLQVVRFDDIFKIEMDIEPAIYECRIVKLILQPVVENAINHGISNLEEGGLITVRGYSKEQQIVFEISDNGQGMDEDKILALNNYINDMNESFKSIGLKNVNKRIKIQYGQEYGVVILRGQNGGTTVRITVPLIDPGQH